MPPKKAKKKKDKNPIFETSIEYLYRHSKCNFFNKLLGRSTNGKNNNYREILIPLIMNNDESIRQYKENPLWTYWFNLAEHFKGRLLVALTNDGYLDDNTLDNYNIIFKQMGGSKYSYDFEVTLTYKATGKELTVPVEYKHQGSFEQLPQIYQKSNVKEPLFSSDVTPYWKYYWDYYLSIKYDTKQGKEKERTLSKISPTLSAAEYKKLVGYSIPNKKYWSERKLGSKIEGSEALKRVNSIYRRLDEAYERSKTKDEELKADFKLITRQAKESINEYLSLIKDYLSINEEEKVSILQKLTGILKKKQYAYGIPKYYMFCDCRMIKLDGQELFKYIWHVSTTGDDYTMTKMTGIRNSVLEFKSGQGNTFTLNLRWQNRSGITNPSWQVKFIPSRELKEKNKRLVEEEHRETKHTIKKSILVEKFLIKKNMVDEALGDIGKSVDLSKEKELAKQKITTVFVDGDTGKEKETGTETHHTDDNDYVEYLDYLVERFVYEIAIELVMEDGKNYQSVKTRSFKDYLAKAREIVQAFYESYEE